MQNIKNQTDIKATRLQPLSKHHNKNIYVRAKKYLKTDFSTVFFRAISDGSDGTSLGPSYNQTTRLRRHQEGAAYVVG